MSTKNVSVIGAILIASCISCAGQNRRVTIGLPIEAATIASVTTVSTARRQWETDGEVRKLDRHTVALPAACSQARAQTLMANIRFVLEVFQEDHGRIERPLIVFVTDRQGFFIDAWEPLRRNLRNAWPPYIQVVEPIKVSLVGVYCPPNEIAVIAGPDDSVPALYHELCHAVLPNAGGDHANPRWKVWNARGEELARRLRDRWH